MLIKICVFGCQPTSNNGKKEMDIVTLDRMGLSCFEGSASFFV